MSMESIGALWLKESKKSGEKFFSGTIEIDGKKTQLTIWKNKFKKEKKHPDYKIFLSDENWKDKKTTDNFDEKNLDGSDGIPF